MPLRSPLFRRLFLPYFALICAGAAAVGWLAAGRLRDSYLEDRRQTLLEESTLLAAFLADDLRPERSSELARRLPPVATSLSCRITVIAEDGRVLADTMADPAHMENHGTRPEILAAARDGHGDQVRFSESVYEELLYVALRAATPDGHPCFVRLSVSIEAMNAHLRALYSGLASVAGAAILLAGAICYTLAARHVRPIGELTRVAQALSRGDFTSRAGAEEEGEIGVLSRSVNEMADSLARLYSQVAQDKKQLLAILSSMNEGVIAVDREQRILLFNEAAVQSLGFERDRAQGKPLWEVIREEPILKVAATAIGSGKRASAQIGPIRERYLEIAASPLPSHDGLEGLVIVAHDTTEAVRYQELRKEFVANVSHELRTPLTFIRGFVETLRDGAIHHPQKGPEYLGIIDKHVTQLTNLVADLLEISRLESRPGLPRRARVDLGDQARHVLDLLMPAALKKRQTLTLNVQPEPFTVVGDPDYLERALTNLLDNAIKYTPEGGAIVVSATHQGACAAIEVSDDGIGIPAADLPRIFERFYRVEKSRSRDMGGTGLGLSIVKHVVQAHGGSVEAESVPGKGTKIRMLLPREV